MCHIVITSIGNLVVSTELLKMGNEELLNNLEEGVVI